MLASVAYSLRTRVKRFRNWGGQTFWLSAHLWFGFVGAVLVTYHSAMKLDRWASIACYLMWLVVVTGAVGRYLLGWVHSTANLVEFERAALRDQCERYAELCSTKGAIGLLLGSKSGERAKRWTINVMLWEQLRDFVALGIVYFFGTRALGSRRERLEMIRCLSSWSRHRRYQHYCESAKPLLKHWNVAHIVLAIAMFILAAIHVVYGFLYKAV
jgi:hypothetical protein